MSATLSTWAEVRDHLVASYTIAIERPHCIGLLWKRSTEAAPLGQRVQLSRANGVEYVEISCDVAHAHVLSPLEALEYNGELIVGALAFDRGGYVMRMALAIEQLPTATLTRALTLIANQTLELRAHHRPKTHETPFALD